MSVKTNFTAPKLQVLYEVSRTINSQLNLQKLLDEIMDRAIELLRAEKGVILFAEEGSEELSVQVARAMDKLMIQEAVAMSRTAIKNVQKHKKPLLLENIPEIPSRDTSKSMLMYKIKSIVCVPLLSKKKLIGTIYLDTTQAEHFFTEDDMHFLEAFANLAAIAIENAKSYQEIEHLNINLENKVAERTEELQQKNEELTRAYQELRDTQMQLIRSEKMASLGQLVAGIVHEMNTPLGSLTSNMDMFIRNFEKLHRVLLPAGGRKPKSLPGEIYKTLELLENLSRISKSACERITQIIKALRNFARLDEEKFKTVDIHEGIDSTLVLIEQQYRERIRIIKHYQSLPKLFCQPAQLNQAFMGILRNACEAIENQGSIRISTRFENDQIVVEINDSGSGISQENLEKVFDPGFTTKGVKVGKGLGLSIAYQIIADHQGSISVDSQLNQGATFTIRLPSRQS